MTRKVPIAKEQAKDPFEGTRDHIDLHEVPVAEVTSEISSEVFPTVLIISNLPEPNGQVRDDNLGYLDG